MAYNKKKSTSKGGIKKAKKGFSETEKFAYQMGRFQIGASNPDSLISESFGRGIDSATKKPEKKKTLF
jgi:hypothetical protein